VLRSWAQGLDAASRKQRYPWLRQFSRNIGLSEETLIASYELEDRFHDLILAEPSSDVRRQLNDEVYTKAFELYGVVFKFNFEATSSPKDAIVSMLSQELAGRSILDIGCGGGDFLLSCNRNIEHQRLLGLDVFVKDTEVPERRLSFRRSDVVRFEVDEPYDVAITDNVYEHIAPQDIPDHLRSIHRALKPGGKVIILTPHRAFGPWDVTRIVDNSNSGWTAARGTHINESTYSELAAALRANGFTDLEAVHPKARLGLKTARSRVPVDRFCRGETRPILMRFLQGMDKRYRYQAFEICMIGTRA
jgi:2-polyprenyl-3-methyl-5-hydroxy-6-metoxy-1,4-benzoquinol methylase